MGVEGIPRSYCATPLRHCGGSRSTCAYTGYRIPASPWLTCYGQGHQNGQQDEKGPSRLCTKDPTGKLSLRNLASLSRATHSTLYDPMDSTG